MLVSKPYANKEIVTFKLVNGDEVVARVLDQTDSAFVIEKPCTVIPAQGGLHLIQSLFSAEINNSIELKFAHVMLHSATTKQIADHYYETTTGIKTLNKGGIIT